MSYMASSERREKRRRKFAARREKLKLPHHVDYFHQLDDPYSYLAAQVLERLCTTYAIELRIVIVGTPNAVDAPEPAMLANYALVDARNIAPYFGLDSTGLDQLPAGNPLTLAQRALLSETSPSPGLVQEVTMALWRGDTESLKTMADNPDLLSDTAFKETLRQHQQQQRKLGHYLGASFYYDGEWYWGVDRLCYLEQRLRDAGLGSGPSVVQRPAYQAKRLSGGNDLVLEYFPSLRSPYTYISMQRVYDMVERTGVELVMRPVLPMMMRGVPASRQKGAYIMFDCKREAESVFQVPFGNICDPFGEPVNRGHSLFSWAREKGKAQQYYLAFTRAAFAEGIDTGTDKGMQYVVEKAGLNWQEARQIIDNRDWEAEYEANRLIMYDEMGVWGVPSFRLSGGAAEPLVAWGADRLWLLEGEIIKRASAANP